MGNRNEPCPVTRCLSDFGNSASRVGLPEGLVHLGEEKDSERPTDII